MREKDLSARDLYALGARLQAALAPYEVPLLINDRLDVALALDAAGVHLAGHSLPTAVARRRDRTIVIEEAVALAIDLALPSARQRHARRHPARLPVVVGEGDLQAEGAAALRAEEAEQTGVIALVHGGVAGRPEVLEKSCRRRGGSLGPLERVSPAREVVLLDVDDDEAARHEGK